MGVPYFFRWVRNSFPQAVTTTPPSDVTTLSIDLNAMIHPLAQMIMGYGAYDDEKRRIEVASDYDAALERLYSAVIGKIQSLLLLLNPRETLLIAVDGKAPLSKIQEQRSRRYMGARNTNTSGVKNSFDPNAISPGTDFMRQLDKRILTWIQNSQELLPPRVIYSPHMGVGEGEHKIFDYFRRSYPDEDTVVSGTDTIRTENTPGAIHVIWGLDADLIVLSLQNYTVNNIYLMRDQMTEIDEEFSGPPRRGEPTLYLDIDTLREGILRLMTGNNPDAEMRVIDDFALIMAFIGNDFLPPLPAFEDPDVALPLLIRVYQEGGRFLTDRGGAGILWENWTAYLRSLLPHESRLLQERYSREKKSRGRRLRESELTFTPLSPFTEMKEFNMEEFRRLWYEKIVTPRHRAADNVFEALGITEISMDGDLRVMVNSYREGLQWIQRYYILGASGVAFDYYYLYRYPPLLSELIDEEISPVKSITTDDIEYNIGHQQLAIMPPQSSKLVPAYYRVFYGEGMDRKGGSVASGLILADLFPTGFSIDYEGKQEERRAIPLIPFADMRRIVDATHTVEVPRLQRNRFFPAPDTIQDTDPEFVRYRLQVQQERSGTVYDSSVYRGGGSGRGGSGRGGGGSRGGSFRGGSRGGSGRTQSVRGRA